MIMGRTIKPEIAKEIEELLLLAGFRHISIFNGREEIDRTLADAKLNPGDVLLFDAEGEKAKMELSLRVWQQQADITGNLFAKIEVSEMQKKKRPYGLAKGLISISDDFDDPLSDEILRLFNGE